VSYPPDRLAIALGVVVLELARAENPGRQSVSFDRLFPDRGARAARSQTLELEPVHKTAI